MERDRDTAVSSDRSIPSQIPRASVSSAGPVCVGPPGSSRSQKTWPGGRFASVLSDGFSDGSGKVEFDECSVIVCGRATCENASLGVKCCRSLDRLSEQMKCRENAKKTQDNGNCFLPGREETCCLGQGDGVRGEKSRGSTVGAAWFKTQTCEHSKSSSPRILQAVAESTSQLGSDDHKPDTHSPSSEESAIFKGCESQESAEIDQKTNMKTATDTHEAETDELFSMRCDNSKKATTTTRQDMSPTYYDNNNNVSDDNVSDDNIRVETLTKKLAIARETINEQNSLIIDLEKSLVDIAEVVCAVTTTGEDVNALRRVFQRAKNVIQAQCRQLEAYRTTVNRIKSSKKKLKTKLRSLHDEKLDADASVEILRDVIHQFHPTDEVMRTEIISDIEADVVLNGDSDVLCIHDTFFTHLKTDLLEKQQLVMESVLCDHLSDVPCVLERLPLICKGKPELVIVHTGKNDIPSTSVDEMCNFVSEIHAFITNNSMKLILCNITPSYEERDLVRKIDLFNRNVTLRLIAYNNVTICKGSSDGNNLQTNDPLGNSCYDEFCWQRDGRYTGDHARKLCPRRGSWRHRPYSGKGKENSREVGGGVTLFGQTPIELQSKGSVARFD